MTAIPVIDLWAGSAELVFLEAQGEELQAFAPKRVGPGYRYSMSCSIGDLTILEDLTTAWKV